MNKKTRHLYSLMGITFVMLLLILVFFDKIPNNSEKIIKSANSPSNKVASNNKEYNPVDSIKLDKDKICLNANDNRYLYTTITYQDKTTLENEPVKWESSDEQVATVNENGVVHGISNGNATITLSSLSGDIKATCAVSVKDTKYVALTFDDGPGPYTSGLLKSLTYYHCKATFFVCGYKIEDYSDVLKTEYELGMEIGNHSYSHKDFRKAKKKDIKKEINSNKELIYDVIGQNPTLLRPPYGVTKKSVTENADVPIILWSVDTQDWNHQNVKYIYNYMIKNAGDGEIMLLHDIHEKTVKGLIKSLPVLVDKGFEFVTVSELYKIKDVELKSGEVYNGHEYAKK